MTHPVSPTLEPLEERLLLSGDVVYALNVGGPTVELNGQAWVADDAPVTGVTTNFVQANATTTSTGLGPIDTTRPSVSLTGYSDPIMNQADLTLDPADYMQVPGEVFSSLRLDQPGGGDLTYLFDVQPGTYRVDLYFADPTHSQPGQRVMDIHIEGALVADDLDIAGEAGTADVAVGRSFLVDSDSALSVSIHSQAGDGVLQGIRVVSAAGSNADLAFNPTTLDPTDLAQISANDVVLLMPGEYHLSDTDIQALFDNAANQRNGVTFLGVPGQTVLDFTDQPELKSLNASTFSDRISNLTFDGLTFLNARLSLGYATGAKVLNSVFDGYAGKIIPEGTSRVASLWRSPSAEFSNNYVRWNNDSFNINGVGVGGSTDATVNSNRVEGRLQKAFELFQYVGVTATGNDVERWAVTTGSEDHGIYVHDASDVLVSSSTMRGWSDTASGNGLKIKNVDHVEVRDNDFYTSGVIGRVETAVTGPRLEQVWIHGNRFHQGSINIWTPTIAPVAVRIEDNVLPHGNITAKRDVDPALFNQALDFGSMAPGGVFNNSADAYDLAPGVTMSGNILYGSVVGDITGDGFVGLADLDVVLSYWNQSVDSGDQLAGDLAGIGDGFVGLSDLDILLANWNTGAPPAAGPGHTEPTPITILTPTRAAAPEQTSAEVSRTVTPSVPDTGETRKPGEVARPTHKPTRQQVPAHRVNTGIGTGPSTQDHTTGALLARLARSDRATNGSATLKPRYIPSPLTQDDQTTSVLNLWDNADSREP